MPENTVKENVPPTANEKIKSSQEIELDEAEAALANKDYKNARITLEKLST
jgi:hypothetical protein